MEFHFCHGLDTWQVWCPHPELRPACTESRAGLTGLALTPLQAVLCSMSRLQVKLETAPSSCAQGSQGWVWAPWGNSRLHLFSHGFECSVCGHGCFGLKKCTIVEPKNALSQVTCPGTDLGCLRSKLGSSKGLFQLGAPVTSAFTAYMEENSVVPPVNRS